MHSIQMPLHDRVTSKIRHDAYALTANTESSWVFNIVLEAQTTIDRFIYINKTLLHEMNKEETQLEVLGINRRS